VPLWGNINPVVLPPPTISLRSDVIEDLRAEWFSPIGTLCHEATVEHGKK